MKIDLSELKTEILNLNNQHVKVAIFTFKKSMKPDFKKGTKLKSGKSGSYRENYILRKGSQKNIQLKELAKILDKNEGIFRDALKKHSNKDLLSSIVDQFSVINKNSNDLTRLENACISVVVNPILNKNYRKNSAEWAKKKTFDMYGVSTGTFIDNVGAIYYGKK